MVNGKNGYWLTVKLISQVRQWVSLLNMTIFGDSAKTAIANQQNFPPFSKFDD